MPDEYKKKEIRAKAQSILRSGIIADVAASGRIGTPIAVQMTDGKLHSWFVPVTEGAHLTGFFQFLVDGTMMRFSSFQRKAGELTGCPAASDWLDPDQIQKRADARRKPEEISTKPFLTYDKTPDRLVWAVPLTNAHGEVRLVYVAGQTVYLPQTEKNNLQTGNRIQD